MGIKRYELNDAQWERVAPLLPGKAGDPGRTGSDTACSEMDVCGFCDPAPTCLTYRSTMVDGRRCTPLRPLVPYGVRGAADNFVSGASCYL